MTVPQGKRKYRYRTLFLYPGQGAQHVGMGRFFFEKYPQQAENLFTRAEHVLNFPLHRLCCNGPEDKLNLDLNAQLAVYVVSCVVTDVLKAHRVQPDVLSGYSSGFYAAAYAAGCFTFEEGLQVVKQAGEILLDTGNRWGEGGMGVVFGLPADDIRRVCRDTGEVETTIYNTPRQIIVSGDKRQVLTVLKQCRDMGALDSYPLPVAAAYHSSFMAGATRRFLAEVDGSFFHDPAVPLYSYSSLDRLETGEQVMTAMGKQLSRAVRWVDLIRSLQNMGIRHWVEAGPGAVISRTVRWIDRKIDIYNTARQNSLARTLKAVLA